MQIRRIRLHVPKPRGWLDWSLAVACLGLIVFAISSVGESSSGASTGTRTATVGRGVVQSTVSGNGTLEPAQKVELSFGASGEVTAIYVKAGEKVSKGKILARIDSSAAQASLASAEAQLSESEEALEAAEEAENEEVSYQSEGQASTLLVAYADPETTTAPSPEEEEKAAAKEEEEAKAKEEAKVKKEKEKAAAEEKQSQETSDGGSEQPEAAPAAPATETTEPTEPAVGAESSAGGSVQSVASAEANLREAELSVESAEQEVSETALRAPFSGTVASISGAVGESISGGSTDTGAAPSASGEVEVESSSSSSAFIVLAELQRLKMEVSFSESDIGKVEVGQIATVAISSMEGTELAGRVTKVSVLPSEGSTSVVEYPATILLTQSAKGLRAGMSASAEVVVEQVSNAITVSTEAIATGPSKTVTVEDDGKEVERTVTTGLSGDETTQVISGLEVGETVVLPEATVASPAAGGEAGAGGEMPGGFSIPSGGGIPSGGPPSGFPGAP